MHSARPVLLLAVLLAVAGSVLATAPLGWSEEESEERPSAEVLRRRVAWVRACLEDLEAIEVGMTRDAVEGRLRRDGGIMAITITRFTHPDCPYFKLDVTFEGVFEPGGPRRPHPSGEERVTKVSRPYLEVPYLD